MDLKYFLCFQHRTWKSYSTIRVVALRWHPVQRPRAFDEVPRKTADDQLYCGSVEPKPEQKPQQLLQELVKCLRTLIRYTNEKLRWLKQ